MSSYYPPGYNGTDGPSTAVVLRCSNRHHWQTTEHHELGTATLEEDCCPTCGEWGDATEYESIDEVPDEEDEDDD